MNQNLPRLVTFDGEARSGKGTIVQHTKDYLRDERGHKVMLIDAGQVFRVLVVAVTRAGVDVDDADAIDAFLADDANAEAAIRLVKDVYHMTKDERDALLYTNEVGVNSAKVGARALSQEFKDDLLRKWLRDAHEEGFDTVLLDGRALEETGTMLVSHNLCDFVLGLYFVCDGQMGARRTLGFAATDYDELDDDEKQSVDTLIEQINERNEKDRNRAVQPVVPPKGAPMCRLPDMTLAPRATSPRPMAIIDTSAAMTKHEMSQPVAEYVADILNK